METEKPPLPEEIEQVKVKQDVVQAPKLCLNCQTVLTDVYCAHCGQRDFPRRQNIGDLLINFISSFWSFESKFIRTGKLILFKPGQLPLEYNEGKRERYFHPARMYVFISFIYFLLLTTLPDNDDADKTNYNFTGKTDSTSVQYGRVVGDYETVAQYDSAQNATPAEQRDGKFEQKVRRHFARMNEKYKGHGDEFSKDFGEIFFANTPRVFFTLLPIFALILMVMYARRDYFYSEHLIFSVYYYNFFFLAGSIYLLLDQIPFVEKVSWFLIVWMFLYLLFAMKRMYRQGWGKTILKYCTFLFIFSFCIGIGLLGNLIMTLIYL